MKNIYLCDCGAYYRTYEALEACVAHHHSGAAELQLADAMANAGFFGAPLGEPHDDDQQPHQETPDHDRQ